MGSLLYLLNSRAGLTLDGLHIYLVEFLHEEVAVLSIDNGLNGSTQHLDTIFLQDTLFVEFHTAVQRRLTTERQQDAVRTLFLNDALHELGRHGLEIHSVSDILRGLHRCNIGVNQHRMNTLFLQRLQCLCTAIVELTGLSNLQGTRA